MKAKGVELFAVCAQPQGPVDEMMSNYNLRYTCYSDITHVLRNHLAEKDYITPNISGGEDSTETFYKLHPTIKNYKYGVVQPGVLCITKERKVLFTWVIEPGAKNIGGASGRPIPASIWEVVQTKLADPNTDIPVDYDNIPRHGSLSICCCCNIL